MRVPLAMIIALVCGPAMAEGQIETNVSTTVSVNAGPFSIGRPHTCAAYYPAEAIKEHAQGTDLLEFIVATNGSVKDVKVSKSSGNKDLDDAAVNCCLLYTSP